MGDDGPTSIDGPDLRDALLSDSARVGLLESTAVDGAPVTLPADPHDTVSSRLDLDYEDDAEDDADDEELLDEPTIYRGDRPPKPSSSRRLSPTLMKVFQRKREQIGLSLAQVAQLSGIEEDELVRFEATNGQHRLVYDHVVLLAKVLGIRPADMPGLRSSREAKDAAGAALGSLQTALLSGPMLTFEGKSGERFGGDLERVGTTAHFGVRLGDNTLGEGWPKGALLGFVLDVQPAPGDVVLVRNKRVKQLALRRASATAWQPVAPWQPAYPISGDWSAMARLHVILPRP
jgi:transcriptional regulator with XRE-family HTH domain